MEICFGLLTQLQQQLTEYLLGKNKRLSWGLENTHWHFLAQINQLIDLSRKNYENKVLVDISVVKNVEISINIDSEYLKQFQ